MKKNRFVLFCILNVTVLFAQTNSLYPNPPLSQVSVKYFWDFNIRNDAEGWTLADSLQGGVSGGALWLSLQRRPANPLQWQQQVWGKNYKEEIISPKGLAIPAAHYSKVRLRILNFSAETDGQLVWRTSEKPESNSGSVHFHMRPDCREWQEVVCHLDGKWSGVIDQIRIRPAFMWWRGDMWIDWIAVTDGPVKPEPPRPDLCSEQAMPHITVPGISQKDFTEAFKVLDECLITDVPWRGFNYPFLAPGGAYGASWWQLDASLNIAGAKWANEKLVEDMMRGFSEVQLQNPDGRIDLYGNAPVRGQPADVSSLPRFFDAAYDVARRSADAGLRRIIFDAMKKYLAYWFSTKKRDGRSGLITAVFEETFSHDHDKLDGIAPIDLNVAVAIGCRYTAQLASQLGEPAEANEYEKKFAGLQERINKYLWDEEKGAYYNYDLRFGKITPRLLCTTFDPLRLNIAPPERAKKLVDKLVDPKLFSWGDRPLTSISKLEPDYIEATGPYDGRAWFGDIWTMRNLPVIFGLMACGRHDLAAELNWMTIQLFNNRYYEYLKPADGSGHGVQRYGWTASQYIQAIVENLFGVDYDALAGRIRILPHIPCRLFGKNLTLDSLTIPCDANTRLHLQIRQQSRLAAEMVIRVSGRLPREELVVLLPWPEEKNCVIRADNDPVDSVIRDFEGLKNLIGIRLHMQEQCRIRFAER